MNGTRDIVFKRCGCTDQKTRRQLAGQCPRLAEPGHGSWYYAMQVATRPPADQEGHADCSRYRRPGLGQLRAALNAAVREGLIPGNPPSRTPPATASTRAGSA